MTPAEFIEKAVYNSMGTMIFAQQKEGLQMLLDVRGWGAIQNMFPTHLEAAMFQDQLGQFVVDAINEKIEREKVEKNNEALNKVIEVYIPVKNPYTGPKSL